MAHTKSQKAASGNRDSKSKRLGVKLYAGQKAEAGNIIIRQKGSKVKAGDGVLMSKDYTLIAKVAGKVNFKKQAGRSVVFIEN